MSSLINTDKGCKIVKDFEFAMNQDFEYPEDADSLTMTGFRQRLLTNFKIKIKYNTEYLIFSSHPELGIGYFAVFIIDL